MSQKADVLSFLQHENLLRAKVVIRATNNGNLQLQYCCATSYQRQSARRSYLSQVLGCNTEWRSVLGWLRYKYHEQNKPATWTCQKNQAFSTITRLVDTLSLSNASSFWQRWHYLWWQKQCYVNEQYLQIQQNKAAKIILGKAKYSSAANALEILKWKRLDQRRHMHRCVFIFWCLNDIIDFDFNFKHNTAFHDYNTRQCNKLHLPAPKTNWGKQKLT